MTSLPTPPRTPRSRGRRNLLRALCAAGAVLLVPGGHPRARAGGGGSVNPGGNDAIRLFLAGDVMTGRGVDQILPHPVGPRLFEPWVKNALDYVRLAEEASGPIDRPVGFDYVWGDALEALERAAPDARIVNLETAVTDNDRPWPGKGIHYRMHPKNLPVLEALGVDVCVLSNNHVLDWGREGLQETLERLEAAGVRTAGAGMDADSAAAPAVIRAAGRRVLVFGFGAASSGIPGDWAAGADQSGVNFLPDLSAQSLDRAAELIDAHHREGDRVIASIHWGGNWGYAVSRERRAFARGLIDRAGVDLIHGHSSHHPIGLEVHRGRLILYGCGDFFNDYEGISGQERFRPHLSLMYLPEIRAADGTLSALTLVPFRIRRMRLEYAAAADARWLATTLTRHSTGVKIRAGSGPEGTPRLELRG